MYIPETSKCVVQSEWRWNRILDLDSQGSAPKPPKDDVYVVKAFRFYKDLMSAGGDDSAQKAVADRYPSLYEAYLLKRISHPATRSGIESLLTAKKSIRFISENLGLSETAVEWYSRLFYDVGDLTAMQVSLTLVPEVHSNSFTADNIDGYFKMVGGCYDADALVDILSQRMLDEGGRQRQSDVKRTSLQFKANKAAAAIPVNQFTAPQILEIQNSTEKTTQEMVNLDNNTGGLAEFMHAILTTAQYAVMSRDQSISKEIHNNNVKSLPEDYSYEKSE